MDPWSELDDGPASTEGAGVDHEVPPDLIDISVACEEAGITPAAFKVLFGGDA